MIEETCASKGKTEGDWREKRENGIERGGTQELCLTVRHDALPQNKQAFSYTEGQPRIPWGRQREREKETEKQEKDWDRRGLWRSSGGMEGPGQKIIRRYIRNRWGTEREKETGQNKTKNICFIIEWVSKSSKRKTKETEERGLNFFFVQVQLVKYEIYFGFNGEGGNMKVDY